MKDKEIMEGLYNMANSESGTSGYTVNIIPYALDLIHRLQSENERLNGCILKYAETLGNEQQKSAELQKRVEELTRKEAHAEGINVTAPMCQEAHEAIVNEMVRQTEQRTAKEILLPLIGCEKQIDPLKTGIRWSVLKGFCKKFDIEVE